MKTYAVKWREPDGQTFIGRLSLGPHALGLDGRRRGTEGAPVNRQFGYEGLLSPRIGSRSVDRLDGRPALVVERPDGSYLVADAGLGAPILQELVERLAGLAGPQKSCGLPATGVRSAPDMEAQVQIYVRATNRNEGGT